MERTLGSSLGRTQGRSHTGWSLAGRSGGRVVRHVWPCGATSPPSGCPGTAAIDLVTLRSVSGWVGALGPWSPHPRSSIRVTRCARRQVLPMSRRRSGRLLIPPWFGHDPAVVGAQRVSDLTEQLRALTQPGRVPGAHERHHVVRRIPCRDPADHRRGGDAVTGARPGTARPSRCRPKSGSTLSEVRSTGVPRLVHNGPDP